MFGPQIIDILDLVGSPSLLVKIASLQRTGLLQDCYQQEVTPAPALAVFSRAVLTICITGVDVKESGGRVLAAIDKKFGIQTISSRFSTRDLTVTGGDSVFQIITLPISCTGTGSGSGLKMPSQVNCLTNGCSERLAGLSLNSVEHSRFTFVPLPNTTSAPSYTHQIFSWPWTHLGRSLRNSSHITEIQLKPRNYLLLEARVRSALKGK